MSDLDDMILSRTVSYLRENESRLSWQNVYEIIEAQREAAVREFKAQFQNKIPPIYPPEKEQYIEVLKFIRKESFKYTSGSQGDPPAWFLSMCKIYQAASEAINDT